MAGQIAAFAMSHNLRGTAKSIKARAASRELHARPGVSIVSSAALRYCRQRVPKLGPHPRHALQQTESRCNFKGQQLSEAPIQLA
jgi:hypothetical protein